MDHRPFGNIAQLAKDLDDAKFQLRRKFMRPWVRAMKVALVRLWSCGFFPCSGDDGYRAIMRNHPVARNLNMIATADDDYIFGASNRKDAERIVREYVWRHYRVPVKFVR